MDYFLGEIYHLNLQIYHLNLQIYHFPGKFLSWKLSLKELNLYFNIMNVKLFLLNQEKAGKPAALPTNHTPIQEITLPRGYTTTKDGLCQEKSTKSHKIYRFCVNP